MRIEINNIQLPAVPNVDGFEYKHYYITKDKKVENQFYLYLFQYEPAAFLVNSNGDIAAYHKYEKVMSRRLYTFTIGQNAWILKNTSTTVQKYSDFTDALVYNNIAFNIGEEQYEKKSMPEDGIVASMEPEFPAIPNLHKFQFKHYYIVQDKTALQKYQLCLMMYEPTSFEVNESGMLVAYHKYGKAIGCQTYHYQIGQNVWSNRSTSSSTLQSYNSFADAVIYNNLAIDLGEEHYAENPLPGDQLVPALEPEFPGIPYLHNFQYKHYYIVQNKTNLERYHLYLLEYEPAYMEKNGDNYLVAYHKYDKIMKNRTYNYDVGEDAWKHFSSSNSLIQTYSSFSEALVYNNFTIDLGEERYAENPLPGDQLIPALEPEFPGIPYLHNVQHKHYYIAQNKTNLERYHLYLLEYEPVYMEKNGDNYLVAYHKYDKAIRNRVYNYDVGQEMWNFGSTSNSIIQNYNSFSGALIYNNFIIDLGEEYYDENPLPKDQIVAALEPEFPEVPYLHNVQYKHYYIVQNKTYLERYHLYLLEYEPAYWDIDTKNYICAYQQYGKAIRNRCYNFDVGKEEWTFSSTSSSITQVYSNFIEALVHNNVTIDFGFEYYSKHPFAEDHIKPAFVPEFPPVPEVVPEKNTYRHYIMIQNTGTLEKYTLYLLEDKPADYQISESSATKYIKFLNDEGKAIAARIYNYTIGNDKWNYSSMLSLFNLSVTTITDSFEYSNFNIQTTASESSSGYLISIPGNSYKQDGTGVSPIVRHGLVKQNGEQYYYIDGVKQKGDGGWLQLNDGRLRTNNIVLYADGTNNWAITNGRRIITKGETYYLKPDGNLARGVEEIHGDSYLFHPITGKLLKILSDGTDLYDPVVDSLIVKEKPSETSEMLVMMIEPTRRTVPLPKDIRDINGTKWIEIFYEGTGLTGKTGWVKLDGLEEYHEPVTEGNVFKIGEGLTVDEKVIEKLEGYYYNNPTTVKDEVDNGGTCIFAFEGLGSYEGGGNNWHPDGMYGAMMLVTKGDKITYITKNSSTLPDWATENSKTLKEGIYPYNMGAHRETYTCLRHDKSPVLSCWCRQKDGTFTTKEGKGINIHAAGNNRADLSKNPWSTLCQLIRWSDYVNFGKAVGFLNENAKDITGGTSAEINRLGRSYAKSIDVTYILDRSELPGNQKGLFYPEIIE